MGQRLTTDENIHGLWLRPLKTIGDDRGMVMHMIRSTDEHFEKFGEIYFSTVKFGVVKAWKRHKTMSQNLAVPHGDVQFVLYDDRSGSETKGKIQEIEIGTSNYQLLHIPPMIWYGFRGLKVGESLVANCATQIHDPLEVDRLDQATGSIPYSWNNL